MLGPHAKLLESKFSAEYCAGLFSDELDQLGERDRVLTGFSLNRSTHRMFGRARTIRLETMETSDERIRDGLGFLDRLNEGDVLLVEGSPKFAYFGELMSRMAMRRRLSGVVIDGLTRDTYFTTTIDLPIFARGYSPVDIKGRGRVAAVDVDIVVGGLAVSPGDFVFGDNDAVVLMKPALMPELLAKVNRTAAREDLIKQHIASGMSVEELLKVTSSF
jgi:4-hydroxy-4-methyl-2-oxoglutarate aldolase